jgi:hypothetical protein
MVSLCVLLGPLCGGVQVVVLCAWGVMATVTLVLLVCGCLCAGLLDASWLHGVTFACARMLGRILYLHSNQLNGSFPSVVSGLSSLL